MVFRVKGGAAFFSLHAQRASATTLAPGSLQLLSNLHLLHVYDLDISVDEPSQNTLSRFGAVQNATAEMSEVLSKALYFIKLPRFLRLAVAEPVSVGKFSEIEWRPAANGRKWTGCLSCSYHGLHFATKGSFTLMRISLCCWDLREHRVRRLHLVDVSCQDSNPTAAVACDYVWSLSELCSENIRMLGVETSFQPWLNGDKVEKRLGRLIGGCCLRDIASGQRSHGRLYANARVARYGKLVHVVVGRVYPYPLRFHLPGRDVRVDQEDALAAPSPRQPHVLRSERFLGGGRRTNCIC